MEQHLSSEIKTILHEFDNIKSSLAPLIAEVKKMQGIHIELKHLKEETDSRLKKLDFELRRLAQKEPPLRDVVSAKSHIEELNRQIDSLKRQYSGMQKTVDISKEVERHIKESLAKVPAKMNIDEKHVYDEISNAKADNKRSISMLKSELTEVDEKHMKLMNTTREKTAALITEANTLSKQVQESLLRNDEALKNIAEFENWFRHSEKTLMNNDQTAKRHMNQIVTEINNNRNDIHSSKKELEKLSQKTESFAALSSKLEKKQTAELSEIKGRMRDAERKMVFKHELDNIKNNLAMQQKEEFSRIVTELDKVKEIIAKDSKIMHNVFESKYKNEIGELKKTLDSLSIKVAGTSKIIEELEKVL